MPRARRVLFLCTGNSARSQIAEALLRHIGRARYEVFSAGTEPRAHVHPRALETLRRHEVPSAGLTPKDVSEFLGQSFDYAITLCDRAREQCPAMPGAEKIHWSFPDPVEETNPERQSRAFEAVFQGLERRPRLPMVVSEKDDADPGRGR